MAKKHLLTTGIVICCILIGYTAFFLWKNVQFTQKFISPLSPIPKTFLHSTAIANEFPSSWKPSELTLYTTALQIPVLTAQSAISYDFTTNRLLYEKNSTQRLPIASLTKIMTALVALETENIHTEVTVSRNAATIGENSMGLSAGEKMTLEQLLYGLILPSGNDAAEAIAQSSPVGRAGFIYLMNKKAETLGLSDTHFTNPTGLEGDGNQYSTAYDLLVMTRYALVEKSEFSKIVSTVDYHIDATATHKAYDLFNETNLLTSYPGVKGVKIGFTNEAGYCLVTYLDYQGHKIIAVLLNSDDRRGEMKELLDYSLRVQGITPPFHP